jgi:dihydrolipoamide dehydrogenase
VSIEIRVPDIGDFKDVPVIEVHVKPGDVVKVEDALITVESDKATMDVPAPAAGTVLAVKIKVGDKVAEGSVILVLDAAAAATEAPKSAPAAPAPAAPPIAVASAGHLRPDGLPVSPEPTFGAGTYSGKADIETEMLVLGAGPGGYSAAFRAADLGMQVVMVEKHATLGGVCLNVGCIPSKALLHAAKVMDEANEFAAHGISFGKPRVDLDTLRAWKAGVVGKLTKGLDGMAKGRKVQVLRGVGSFIDPHHLAVETAEGGKVIKFRQAIIAAGSAAVKLPFIPDDPRIVDSTGALELRFVPKSMLVIGGGIIGLEMATVYSALGAKISVVEMLDGLMPGADRDLVKVWEKRNATRFERIMLKTRTVAVEAKKDGLWVKFEGENAPAEPQRYDMILVSTGRAPNGKKIKAEAAGVAVTERGFIEVSPQLRTNVSHIFAIGDIVGQPMLAHKAVHEAHVAAEAAAGQHSHFDAAVIPAVAYTDPEIAWVGLTEEQARAQGRAVEKGLFPWAASGRAIANGADYGFTKLLFDADTHRIVGGGIVGPHAGDLIGEVCLAIEMGADAIDIGKTIHPHPTFGETVGLAAEAAHGSCTDLPAARKK